MSETIASRAILMFWKVPRMWILLHFYQLVFTWRIWREDSRVSKNDAGTRCVLDSEFSFAILTRNTT